MWEIFDLQADPKESVNLLETGQAPQEVAEALLFELAKWIPESEKKALRKIGNRFKKLPKKAKMQPKTEDAPEDATSDEELSDTEREMLRALGYVE